MKRLILVDDHAILRQALSETLSSKGKYSVVGQAGDGNELLNMLNSSSADLIIMDLSMPNLDGISAIERMKSNNSQVPVLVLSANEGKRHVRSALSAGARGYIPKNAGVEELEFAIDSILSGKTYLSPAVTADLVESGDGTSLENSPLSTLSKRELEIFIHLADGKPNRIIGKLLHISTRTVDTHRSNIMKKLNLKTNAELAKLAFANNLLSL